MGVVNIFSAIEAIGHSGFDELLPIPYRDTKNNKNDVKILLTVGKFCFTSHRSILTFRVVNPEVGKNGKSGVGY